MLLSSMADFEQAADNVSSIAQSNKRFMIGALPLVTLCSATEILTSTVAIVAIASRIGKALLNHHIQHLDLGYLITHLFHCQKVLGYRTNSSNGDLHKTESVELIPVY